MGEGEGEKLDEGGELPDRICKSIPQDSLCRPDDVTPVGVAVCIVRNPRCWDSICTTGGGISGGIYLSPIRGQWIGGH